MQKLLSTFLVAVVLLLSSIPLVTFAVVNEGETDKTPTGFDRLVPCGTESTDGIVDNPCQFSHAIELGRRIILAWIVAGVTIAALGFAYAGFLYITAMGSQEKISHAHSIFFKTFLGFVFMLSAWLIAKTIENHFLSDDIKDRSFLQES